MSSDGDIPTRRGAEVSKAGCGADALYSLFPSAFNAELLTRLAMFSPQASSSSAAAAISPLLMVQAPSTSSSSLGGGSAGGQLLARNSTKTLKCPKCNWHYKYQETLEIHMKEKHDIDGASGMECCVYCLEGLAHPKLARGESYSCGYKPYRCDLCKYSTTTKGNLSIHMQSDKHLNAVQESIPSASSLTHHHHSPFSFANPSAPSTHCGLSGHGHADGGIAQERILGASSSTDGGGDGEDKVDVKLICDLATAAEGGWQIFDCLICRNFSTSDAEAMLDHIELDRSAVPPMPGDIQHLHGLFRCNLCPYSSSLKANFQLHTRTDKHLQRLQLINHIREGGDSVCSTAMDPLSRLSSMKNPVQVRCHLCQEILTCPLSLREHCENPAVHLRRLQYLLMREQVTGPIDPEATAEGAIPTLYEALLSHKLIFKCSFQGGNSTGKCEFSTTDVDEAIDHLVVHRGSEAISASTLTTIDDTYRGEDVLKNDHTRGTSPLHQQLHSPLTEDRFSWSTFNAQLVQMDEACVMSEEKITASVNPAEAENRFATADREEGKKDAHTGADRLVETTEWDRETVGEAIGAETIPADRDEKEESFSSGNKRQGQAPSRTPVAEHRQDNINAVGDPCDSNACTFSEQSSTLRSEIYPHQCPRCSMAFKTQERLKQHRLSHSSFVLEQKCQRGGRGRGGVDCEKSFSSPTALQAHLVREHTGAIEGPRNIANHHSTSTEHDLINEQLMSLLLRQPHSSTFLPFMQSLDNGQESRSVSGQQNKKPYRCNVCRLSYAISSALDTHLRSFAHQSRMQRLQELVERGEVNSRKPVSEQPGGIPQKLIAELVDADAGAKPAPLADNLLLFNNDDEEPTDLSIRRSREPPGTMRMGKSTPMKSSSSKSKGHIGLNYSSPPSKRGTADTVSKNSFGCVFDQAGSQTIANQNPLFTSFITQMAMAQMAALQHQQQQQLLQQSSSEHAVADGNKNLLQKKIMEAAMGVVSQYSPMLFNPFLAANPFANVFNPFSSQTEMGYNTLPPENGESLEPKAKRPKTEQAKASAHSNNTKAKKAPEAVSAANQEDLMRGQLTSLIMGGTGNGNAQASFSASNPFASQGVDFTAMLAAIDNSSTTPHSSSSNNNSASSRVDGDESPQQKRARTRITDDQLKVLRQYFDINNSPSEEQVKEMSHKAQLPEKVIKHWFRNTLFKERQRDKDSPYNFSVPPQLTIDLATYEKTGEAKVTPLKVEPGTNTVAVSATTTPGRKSPGDAGDDPRQQVSSTKATPSPTGSSRSPSISSTLGRRELVMSAASRTIKREREDDETSIEHTPSPTTPLTSNISHNQEPLASTGTAEERNFLEQWQKIMAATNMMTGFSMSPTVGYSAQGVPAFNPALFFGGGAMVASVAANERPASNSTDNNKQPDLSALLASSTAAPPTLSNAASSPLFNNFLSSMTRQQHQKGTGTSSSSRNTPQPGSLSLSASPPQQPKAATSVPPPPPPPPLPHSMACSTSVLGGGRRANRTRFTDFQLKALQNFFDRQAYPKDDDLEALSKKLGLSPRVIVVWFQNARQKARKIFENNPVALSAAAAAAAAMAAGSSHPAVTMAHLVHQQGEQRHSGQPTAAAATTEESLSEEEKNTPLANGKAENPTLAALFGRNSYESAARVGASGNEGGGEGGSPAASLMALLSASGSLNFASLNGCSTTGLKTKKDEPAASRQGSAEPREIGASSSFHKRCPFCAHAYQTRDGLAAHIPRRHPEQAIGDKALDFLIDTLPNCMLGDGMEGAERNPHKGESAHETSAGQERFSQNDEGDEDEDYTSPLDLSRPTGASHSPPPHSPRSPSNVRDEEEEEGEDNYSREASITSESRLLSPSTRRSSSLGSQRHIGGIFHHHSYHHQRPGSRGSSKRYRTHLTPMQVFVMKCVFNDYKTPSMGECDSLGRQIGLHKRVVQVWFQNARAKMRKSRGEEEAEDLKALPSIGSLPDTRECELCTVDFAANGTTMQEHLLSDTHINNIRERGALLRGSADRAESESHGEYDEPTQNHGQVVGDAESVGMGKQQENHERNRSPNNEDSHSSPLATNPFGAAGQIPFNLAMLPSQVMLFGDPTLYGTPIKLLQIPTTVQERITSELKSGSDSCKFTQDGLQLSQLAKKISASDFKTATTSETEVGWACRNCSNVFQQQSQLQNHQKLVCQTPGERAFRLIQIFYECTSCSSKFGTQVTI